MAIRNTFDNRGMEGVATLEDALEALQTCFPIIGVIECHQCLVVWVCL